MRDLKFRAWDKEKQQFCEASVGMCNHLPSNWQEFYILLQYTGLKNIKGVEIYEADYIGGIWNGYIKYCEICKSFELFLPRLDICMSCLGDVSWREIVEDEKNLEVIGNIYEGVIKGGE